MPEQPFDRTFPTLRHTSISPYRVVYEIVGEQCRVLAIVRCSSMLVRNELLWDK